jgi:hypothetical protein
MRAIVIDEGARVAEEMKTDEAPPKLLGGAETQMYFCPRGCQASELDTSNAECGACGSRMTTDPARYDEVHEWLEESQIAEWEAKLQVEKGTDVLATAFAQATQGMTAEPVSDISKPGIPTLERSRPDEPDMG